MNASARMSTRNVGGSRKSDRVLVKFISKGYPHNLESLLIGIERQTYVEEHSNERRDEFIVERMAVGSRALPKKRPVYTLNTIPPFAQTTLPVVHPASGKQSMPMTPATSSL